MIRSLAALLLLTAACSSPLTRAARLGRIDEVLSSLPGERGRCGPALNAAAANDHEDVLKILLDGGCDVDAKDSDGYTALMAAAARGHEGCVRLLLERKADPDLKSWNDNTAATLARKGRHKGTMKLLETFGLPPMPEPVKPPEPRKTPAPPAAEEVRVIRLARAPREYMGRTVRVRGRVSKVIDAGGREYAVGLAEPGKPSLDGERRLGVARLVMLVDDQGGKCSFIFGDGAGVPAAGQEAELTGRYLGDALRAAASASGRAPGVYLEAIPAGGGAAKE